jgi:hypothetical protein
MKISELYEFRFRKNKVCPCSGLLSCQHSVALVMKGYHASYSPKFREITGTWGICGGCFPRPQICSLSPRWESIFSPTFSSPQYVPTEILKHRNLQKKLYFSSKTIVTCSFFLFFKNKKQIFCIFYCLKNKKTHQ